MHLLLGQLVYTSFTGSGFRLLASKHVPKEVQQAFIQQIVSSYWDSYNPPPPEYSAVYLHQVTPEHTLFGWLYNDGVDDVGRSNVPYFICYYLAEPLFNFQLANIFTCLENGPIALINRYSSIPSLETKEIADLWSYQGVKPGVAVPFSIRKHSYVALKQRQLLNLFISVYEQEMIVEPGSQTYEQQIGNLSIYTSYIIEGFNIDAAINQKTAIIHGNTIQPYQKNQHILGQLHKKTKAHNRLSLLPKSLLFKTKEPIKAWLEQHLLATKLQKKH